MNGWRSLSAKENGKNIPVKMESLLKGKSAGTKKDILIYCLQTKQSISYFSEIIVLIAVCSYLLNLKLYF